MIFNIIINNYIINFYINKNKFNCLKKILKKFLYFILKYNQNYY